MRSKLVKLFLRNNYFILPPLLIIHTVWPRLITRKEIDWIKRLS